MLPEVGQLGVEGLNAARRWARARGILRRTLDSKAASRSQRDKAKRAYDKASTDLETVIGKLEQAMRATGPNMSMDKARAAGAAIPWNKLFGIVSEVAKAAEIALEAPSKVTPQIIDATPLPDKE